MAAHEEQKGSGRKIPQLLHPELMSVDDLRTILADRCIKLSDVHSMSKEHLVAVVRRVALPLPQRLCFAKSTPRKFAFHPRSTASSAKRDSNPTNKRLSDCIDYKHKTIKLKRSSETNETKSVVENQKVVPSKRPSIEIEPASQPVNSVSDKKEENQAPQKKARTQISWP